MRCERRFLSRSDGLAQEMILPPMHWTEPDF